jgi:hypothetical protein
LGRYPSIYKDDKLPDKSIDNHTSASAFLFGSFQQFGTWKKESGVNFILKYLACATMNLYFNFTISSFMEAKKFNVSRNLSFIWYISKTTHSIRLQNSMFKNVKQYAVSIRENT